MPHLSHRLAEVKAYFTNNDLHLGYRRLLDAAIETGNFSVYKSTLEFCDWYDGIGEPQGAATAISERVDALLTLIENGTKEPAKDAEAVSLKATQISKRYSRGSFNLSPLDLTLHRSQIIGLVGENGNGKTTLLRLLFGELKTDTGRIEYRFSKTSSSFYDIKSRLAFIPQRPLSWYGSLMDNLQYASSYAGYKGEENFLWTEMIIARMGLRPYRSYNWNKISSGYKMRFELARTLLRKPQVLMLDEPLANLDMLAQQIILEDLKFLASSATMPLSVILSSQQLYEVEKVSDQVIFLQRGVAKYQYSEVNKTVEAPLVLELETIASRDALHELLNPVGLQQLSFNGGVYILHFNAAVTVADVLTAIGGAGMPVKYFRDISLSSRRFFVA